MTIVVRNISPFISSLQNVQGLILTPNISKINRLRLVMLYALRYEKQVKDIEELVRLLKTRGASEAEAKVQWLSL